MLQWFSKQAEEPQDPEPPNPLRVRIDLWVTALLIIAALIYTIFK